MVNGPRALSTNAAIVTIELVVAIALLTGAMLPVAYSFVQEARAARACYFRAVAMSLVDGEMEVLMAGEWRAFHKGQQPYRVRGEAATNLPAGAFILTIDDRRVRLEWRPSRRGQGGLVWREAPLSQASEGQTR